jgi:Flp pilus assembly protein TadD
MCAPAARRRLLPAVLSLIALATAAPLAGCASLAAARAFRSGTEALDRGETGRAVAELERAAALAPTASAVHNHLGIAYEAAGRRDDARRAYERAVELDCANQAAWRNLAALRAQPAAVGEP